jgi:fumarylpyruvate hydrolase
MKIICVGLNYKKHLAELNRPQPSEPVIFMKPDSSIIKKNKPFFLPDFSDNIQYETELVVRIDKLGKAISKKFASRYYNEITLGIDITARDMQQRSSAMGLPWELSKGFDGSAPLGEFIPLREVGDIGNIDFHLDINGKRVQTGNSADMIFSIDEIIEYVSRYFTLKTGDLIFTGTPEGVGPLRINDRLEGYIGNRKLIDFRIK